MQAAQVLKHLRLAGSTLRPAHLYNPQILNHYMKTLDDQGKKASTQHGILCRIKQGLTHVNLTLDHQETVKAEKCSQLICHWLSVLGKEVKRVKQKNLEDISDALETNLTENSPFATSQTMTSLLRLVTERAKREQLFSTLTSAK